MCTLIIKASLSKKSYLFLFSSSAISCLCCLFASMVKEMSGALLCWVGCCKICGLHYLVSGRGIYVCLKRQESWDMHMKKTTIFIKTKKAKHVKLNSYSSPKDQLLGRSGAHLWDGKQKEFFCRQIHKMWDRKLVPNFWFWGLSSFLPRCSHWSYFFFFSVKGLPDGSDGKESACNAGDLISILWSGRSPGEGNGYPLQ